MHEGLLVFALVSFGGFLGISDKWFCLAVGRFEVEPGDKQVYPGYAEKFSRMLGHEQR